MLGRGDRETRGIVDFNKMVQEDERVENVLLSIRDGVMVIRKVIAPTGKPVGSETSPPGPLSNWRGGKGGRGVKGVR